jgi:hypothetical protein
MSEAKSADGRVLAREPVSFALAFISLQLNSPPAYRGSDFLCVRWDRAELGHCYDARAGPRSRHRSHNGKNLQVCFSPALPCSEHCDFP